MNRLLYFSTFFLCTFLQAKPLTLTHGSWTEQGNRSAQEDRYFPTPEESSIIQIPTVDQAHFFGVYDGHGGDGAAVWTHAILHKYFSLKASELFKQKEEISATLIQALKQSFIEASRNYTGCFDGTTATVALFADSKLYCANVGDTQAVLSRKGKARTLTTKHTVNNHYSELQKNPYALLYEDFVTVYPHYEKFPFTDENLKHQETQRSWTLMMEAYGRMYKLNLCRTLGDKLFSDSVIPQPDISIEHIALSDEFVIIASNGLWDVMGLQAAVDFVHHELIQQGITADHVDVPLAQEIAQKLIKVAHQASAHDNITTTIIFLNHQYN